MPRSVESARDYLRLVARLLWQPGVQRALDLSDVVQQPMLKAHAHRDQFRGTTDEEWRGWLRAILRNELLRVINGNPAGVRSLEDSSRRMEDSLADKQTSPSEAAIRHEQLEQLAAALGQLLEDERTAVELKHLHGCSVELISQHLGKSKAAVGGLLKRGMHRLRLLLHAGDQEKG
jgi:RNA polymerase sigma-70 factor (ECF subfamily)